MATFFTSRLLFLHVPKTGGTWITGAVDRAGLSFSLPPPVDGPVALRDHANLAAMQSVADGRLTSAFVRHPLDWWRSYWAYRLRDGWTDDPLDTAAASDDFDEFIRVVVERFPGYASAIFSHYLGAGDRRTAFIGRFENLVADTVRMLTEAGETFSEAQLRAHPPDNVTDYDRLPALYRPTSARRLAEAERAVIERFYRADPVPVRLLARRRRPSVGGLFRRS